MGGMGSGRNRLNRLLGEVRSVDVRALHRRGALADGVGSLYKWKNQGMEIAYAHVRSSRSSIAICYRVVDVDHRWSTGHFTVNLVWIPCNYGGIRPFFICPSSDCRRHAATLYLGDRLNCRVCQHLSYPCQRISPCDRSLARTQAIRVKLGGSADISLPFPAKPKGMNSFRYVRLSLKALRAQDEADADVIAWVNAVKMRNAANK